MKYPYILAPGSPKGATTPLVPVIFKHLTKETTPILTLLDSGASVSFAPLDLAIYLGIRVDKNKSLNIRGFNNTFTECFPGIATINIGGHEVELKIYFGGSAKFQCILGQDPFFNMARIIFERYDNSFSIDWLGKKVRFN